MRYIVTDRTRHNDYEKCPRLRLLTHEYPNENGIHGATRQQLSIPLLTGGIIHKGLELFVSGQSESEAVIAALDAYDQDAQERGLELDELAPEPKWTALVQRTICEALIRGWARKVWPKLNAEFEVLDIEQEETLDVPVDEETIIRLMTRSDLILRRKADGNTFVFNHKSISEPTEKKLQSLRYDTQSISEVLAAQARYDFQFDDQNCTTECIPDADSRPCGGRAGSCTCKCHRPIQIDGVIYDLLVKGPRKVEYPKGSGVWHNTTPLAWCYVKEGQTGITPDEIAAKYEYTCTAPHKMYRKECPGNANHKLGPQWHRKPVTEVFGNVENWFDWLEMHEPGLIEAQFQTLAPVMRSPFDVERWKGSVLTEEWAVAERADHARMEILDKGWREAQPVLDTLFPPHTAHGNCFWPGKCPMWEVCWGTGGQVDDLLQIENNEGNPMYVPRKSNHPEGIIASALEGE